MAIIKVSEGVSTINNVERKNFKFHWAFICFNGHSLTFFRRPLLLLHSNPRILASCVFLTQVSPSSALDPLTCVCSVQIAVPLGVNQMNLLSSGICPYFILPPSAALHKISYLCLSFSIFFEQHYFSSKHVLHSTLYTYWFFAAPPWNVRNWK